jgi:hypothetical protein
MAPDRSGPFLRREPTWLAASVWLYLLGVASTTFIALLRDIEDWYLYGLMGLCTAVLVTAHARFGRETSWARWLVSWLLAELAVVAWSLLLAERTLSGWRLTAGGAVRHAPEPLFWLPVGLQLACALVLAGHLVWRAGHRRGLPPPTRDSANGSP